MRLKNIRKYYGFVTLDDSKVKAQLGLLTKKHLEELTRLYVHWRDEVEYIPMRMTYREQKIFNFKDTPIDPVKWCKYHDETFRDREKTFRSGQTVYCEGERQEWIHPQTIKRGNKPYIRLVKKKFKPLIENSPLEYFPTENPTRKRKRNTNLLYLTGTCDQTNFNGIADSWLKFGKLWNKFTTNLRGQFRKNKCLDCGKIFYGSKKECSFCRSKNIARFYVCEKCGNVSLKLNRNDKKQTVCAVCDELDSIHEKSGAEYIRTWQSQKNGYPHFHALVWFPFDFSVVPNWGKKDKLTWRLTTRQKLNKGDSVTVRQRIKTAWKGGNLDICAVSDIGKAFKDMLKYITRDLEGGESDLTNAMAWYFGKRSYSISKHFQSEVWGTGGIDLAEPTNADLIEAECSNSNSDLKRIEVFPIIKHEDLDFSYQKDILNMDHEPDPPPNVVDYFEDFVDLCEPVIFNQKTNPDGSTIDIIVYRRKQN